MTPDTVIDIFREAIYIIMLIVCVLIVPALIVGLLISMFQAATQINEQTLTFIPRLLIVFFVLIAAGPWLLNLVISLTLQIFRDIPLLIG